MSDHYRALVALLVITLLAYGVVRWIFAGTPFVERFTSRMQVWFGIQIAAFVLPSFWLAMAAVAAFYFYLYKKDDNPVAIYLMFFLVLPPLVNEVPGFGLANVLVTLSNFRLISLVVLLPWAIRLLTRERPQVPAYAGWTKLCDLAFGALFVYQVLAFLPYEAGTPLVRRVIHMTLDLALPYFVISRSFRDRKALLDALAALVMIAMVLSILAVFENAKGWVLYDSIDDHWGLAANIDYLRRDGVVRALVTTGHPLALGNFLVLAVGVLGVFARQLTATRFVMALVILAAGLVATISRGPWLAASVVLLLMGLFSRRPARYYGTLVGAAVLFVGVALVSPWSAKIIGLLPFVGGTETGSIDYRGRILDTTLMMMRQNPIFGSVVVRAELEDLRQGQGIIDIVNVYALFAMKIGRAHV
jgi:hypothetical protein